MFANALLSVFPHLAVKHVERCLGAHAAPRRDDRLVGVKHQHAFIIRHLRRIAARLIDRHDDGDARLAAGVEVVLAKARRHVDDAGAVLIDDEVFQKDLVMHIARLPQTASARRYSYKSPRRDARNCKSVKAVAMHAARMCRRV